MGVFYHLYHNTPAVNRGSGYIMAKVRRGVGGGERSALTQEEADGETSFNWMVVLRQIGHGHG